MSGISASDIRWRWGLSKCGRFYRFLRWPARYILAKKPIPKTSPILRDLIRQIAMLGGFLGRKGDGEPGAKNLWLGFQHVSDFVEGVEPMRAIHAK